MKYKDVEDVIKRKIMNGEYKVGQQLEDVNTMSKEYNVSQMTLSRALTNLSTKGYLRRVKGKGTFVKGVVGIESKRQIIHTGLGEDITSRGMKPGVSLLEYRVVKATDLPKIKKLLDVEDDDMFHYFVRLRTGNGIPLIYSVYYMPVSRVPYLDINTLNNGSIWEYLGKAGYGGITNEEWEIKIAKAQGRIAKNLKVDEGHPLLNSHQINALENHKPFSYIDTYMVPERFPYKYKTMQVIR